MVDLQNAARSGDLAGTEYMKIFHPHPWDVTIEEAVKIQEGLAKYIIKDDGFKKIDVIGGMGIAFGPSSLVVSIVRFTFPDLIKIDWASDKFPLLFPYTPNLLAFSCGPAILSVLERVDLPDLFVFPGKGTVHPRKAGLATHLGILLGLPTIACSKRALIRNYTEPGKSKGSYEYIYKKREKIGLILRSKDDTKPIFISPGNKISLESSLKIILSCCAKYRLPEPLRRAQILARKEMLRAD